MTENNPHIQELFHNMDKKQLRLIKNRQAADISRKRKKMEFQRLESRVAELEKENQELQERIVILEQENQQLMEEKKLWDQRVVGEMASDPFLGKIDIPSPFSIPSPDSHGSTSMETPDTNDLFDFIDFDHSDGETLAANTPSPFGGSMGLLSIFLLSFSFLLPIGMSNYTRLGSLSTITTVHPPSSIPQVSLSSWPLSIKSNPKDSSNVVTSKPSTATTATTLDSHSLESLALPNPDSVKSIKESLTKDVIPLFSKELGQVDQSHQQLNLPTQRKEFINSLKVLKQLNPPNAVQTIESLFQVTETIDNSYHGTKGLDATLSQSGMVMLGPYIKIVPFDTIGEQLKLSLFTYVPSGSVPGGILRLDMDVFKATWLS